MNEEKLIGYIKGEITTEVELAEILVWIESSPENQKQYNRLKNLWVVAGLDHPQKGVVPAFHFHNTKQSLFTMPFVKYAAVFILAFVLGSLSLYLIIRPQDTGLSSRYNVIEVPNGERSQVSLYDGTKVWLNSGTTFRYPVTFSRRAREVFVEGEAYFDVAEDPGHPFIVRGSQLKVEVLGTRFNVCAYPDDDVFSATLEEGSVNAVNTENGMQVTLKPGEQVVLDLRSNRMEHLSVKTELYTSWKENLLRFESATFEEVIKKMEHWYDVKITVAPSINIKERYTMTIKTESLREMLQLLSRTTKMDYEINANNVFIKSPR
jgi:ferric-dicitrate binding protein FerR (iron transport regulator)